jgi:four helix bundle protein
MPYDNLKRRFKKFALDVIKMTECLSKDVACKVLVSQLIRSASSAAANYRAACRAKSNAHFISKLGDVEEEADESGFWLEMLVDAGKLKVADAAPLIREAGELTAITVTSINTARKSGGRS